MIAAFISIPCRLATLGLATMWVFSVWLVAKADLESGPKAGSQVPSLKVFGVVGAVEGKVADFAAERKDVPTVYVFVAAEESGLPKGGRPAARFLKMLDEQVGDCPDAAVVAVWLGDKAFERHKEYLPRFQQSLRLHRTHLAAYGGGVSGPDGWGINPEASLTVVLAHQGKVVRTWAFDSVNETDVRPIMTVLKQAVKPK